jgi:hypothetical protein
MSTQRPIHMAMVVALLATLACSTLFPQTPISSEPAVAALALRLDGGQPHLSSFVGPITASWYLPEGSYFVSAVDQDGLTLVFSEIQIDTEPLMWPSDFESADALDNPESAAAIKTLAGFLVKAEGAELTALENSSAGFGEPLFTTEPGQAELDELHALYTDIAAQEPAVLNALDLLFGSLASERGSHKFAAPARGIKDALLGFFGYAGNAGKRARERILKISESLNPEDEADAFHAVREAFKGDANSFDEFLSRLRSGELDTQAAQIESDMRNAPGFGAAARVAGASVGQVVHEEGAQLVTRGAELQAEVIKGVLGDVFPDITKGFDLADKANEWAEYIQTVYKDPLVTAEGEGRGALEEKIKERILSDLQRCCPGLDEDLADEIASKVSEKAVSAIPQITTGLGTTELPASPMVNLRFTVVETVAGGAAKNTSTSFVLTADFQTGTVVGSLEGMTTYDAGRLCVNPQNPSETWDYLGVTYDATYTADVTSSLDVTTGEFSASIDPAGQVVNFTITQLFTDSRCIKYNSEPPPDIGPFSNIGPFQGTGTISGVISRTGEATLTTDWQAGNAQITGSWSGQGQVAP